MKHIKKIAALVLAFSMVLSMSSVAFAAETTTKDGVQVDDGTAFFTINKEIVLFNTDGSAIYEPNVAYTYKVTGVNPNGAKITDNPATKKYDGTTDTSVTVAVKEGKEGGVTIQAKDSTGTLVGTASDTATVTFGDTDSHAFETNVEGTAINASSKVATRDIVVTVDPASNAFKDNEGVYVPGVYRYHIAETSNTAEANGVKLNANRVTDLTLDVYLHWTDNNRTALEVYGYVLFKGLSETEDLSYNDTTSTAAKVTGFDVESSLVTDTQTTTTATADEYHTFNTTISKTVTGNLADKNNPFPFDIDMTGINSTEFYWTRTGRAIEATKLTMGAGASISTNLKDGETIKITGLPYNATVKAKETNNTPDYYTPSATFKAGTADAADLTGTDFVITDSFNPTKTAETAIFNNGKAETAKKLTDVLTEDVIAFTNNLTEISPTGYVVRIAPYVLMLAGGVALLIVTRRRREDSQAA